MGELSRICRDGLFLRKRVPGRQNMLTNSKKKLEKKNLDMIVELSGAFAFGGKDVQKKLLEADGIEVVNGTVDLKKYGLTQRDDKL